MKLTTSVQWLQEKLLLSLSDELKCLNEFFVIAKEMEKEQIIDSYTTGLIDPLIMKNYKGLPVDEIRIELKKQAAEYYNETFKN